MSRTTESNAEEVMQRRPATVASLLVDGRVGDTWFGANRNMNRFFVLNLRHVINLMALSHTLAEPFFHEAAEVIAQKTKWPEQYNFEYSSSKIQIFPKKLAEPKRFGTAATIIVAMELASKETKAAIDVYDYLRILPATSFIDGLDERWVARAEQWSQKEHGQPLSEILEEKLRKAGDSIGPTGSVLKELSQGYCVTQWAANAIVAAVKEALPHEFEVGPVHEAGEDEPSNWKLGTRNVAPSLKVPKTRDPAELSPLID